MATRNAALETAAADSQQPIEVLQQRYEQLNKQKIQCETKLDHARDQLATLKREARDKYGTEDLGELQAKLEQMKAENEQKRASYQADLDRIDADLAQVELNFQTTEGNAAKGLQ
jgi:multidrug resistance efflux pump